MRARAIDRSRSARALAADASGFVGRLEVAASWSDGHEQAADSTAQTTRMARATHADRPDTVPPAAASLEQRIKRLEDIEATIEQLETAGGHPVAYGACFHPLEHIGRALRGRQVSSRSGLPACSPAVRR